MSDVSTLASSGKLEMPSTGRENLRGILAMLAGMGCMIVNDAFFKLATAELPSGEAIFLRGVFTTLLCMAAVTAVVGLGALRLAAGRWVQVRTGTDVLGTMLYYAALAHMPIADATAILQFVPLAIAGGAAIFLGAQVSWRRWLATLAGLAGVLLIVRPGTPSFNGYSLLALSAIGFMAARDLVTRRVGAQVPTLVVAAASAASLTAGSMVMSLFQTWLWPSPSATLLLLAASIGMLGGTYWMVVATRTGDIAAVAPFRYSLILWAIAIGFVVWGVVPDLLALIGIAIVCSAGVYAISREHRGQGQEEVSNGPVSRVQR
jgi:drug/metabolite transporter (DMT)-like permease